MANAAAIQAGEAFVKFFVKDAEAMAALGKLQSRIQSFAAETAAIGKGVLLSSGLVAIPFMKAMRTFAGYEDRMSAVGAIIRATDKEFEALNNTAQALAGSFRATQIAEGMLELGRAGFEANEIMDSIPGTLHLARAGAIDLGEATAILANTIRSFGLAAKDLLTVQDATSPGEPSGSLGWAATGPIPFCDRNRENANGAPDAGTVVSNRNGNVLRRSHDRDASL